MTALTAAAHSLARKARGRPRLANRLFYGWIMIPIAMLAMMCTAPAQTYGMSVFNPYLRESLGLSPGKLALAYSLGTLLACLPLTGVGGLMDRYGIRRTMAGIVVLFTGACFLISQAMGWWSILLAFFCLRLFGQGSMMVVTLNTLPQWFNRRLGLAMAIFNIGVAGAIAFAPQFHLWLIREVGWRDAYILLGIAISFVLLPLLIILFRNRPEDIGQRPDGVPVAQAPANDPEDAEEAEDDPAELSFTLGQAVRTRAYWIMMADTAFDSLGKTAIAFSAVTLFTSRGMSAAEAALIFTIFGAVLAVARLVAGILADRLPLNLMLAAAATCMTLLMFSVWQAHTPWVVAMAGMFMGLQQGIKGAVDSTLWRRYYGRAHLGRIRGSFMTVLVASGAVGPILFDGVYDLTGSYNKILAPLAFVPIPLIIAAFFATRPKGHPQGAGTAPA